MFEINNDEMMKKQAEHEAIKMFARMMSQAILESESAPESMKLSVLVMDKSEDVTDSIHNLVKKYVQPKNRANAETLKKVVDYLKLVELGIIQFLESTPFVAEEEIEEEE